jgi:3,4-dihydroxy 2-butanone 4-phosphate synthase / GTP cyclohydrolase II
MSGKDDFSAAISPIEEIVEEARNGRMFILVDAEDRENEGDLIIPAQFATPAQVNFMAKHGRGLICLSLTRERAGSLELDMMARENRESMKTAFTVSIEAREGVTTGISAHDRAHTIAVAIDPTKGATDIVSPGHVFPLVAREGGVLVRAGHTEASVDISRLAGLYPAAVICEIMNDDGSMARLPELVSFAQLHGMKIGTIADLISWRRRHDRFLERRMESDIETSQGPFRIVVFRNTLDNVEHVAVVRGRIQAESPTLVRVHRVDFLADVLGESGRRSGLVGQALQRLAEAEEPGVAVLVRMGLGEDIARTLGALEGAPRPGETTATMPLREYGVGAQILKDLGVRRMILLSNTRPGPLPGLDGHGLAVEGWRRIDTGESG